MSKIDDKYAIKLLRVQYALTKRQNELSGWG